LEPEQNEAAVAVLVIWGMRGPKMKPLLTVALVAVAAVTLAPRPADAAERPWCLFTKGEEHCSYNSLDACLRDRMGGSDFCNPNARYKGETPRAKPPPRRPR
jgi:hypothetical protein